MKQFKIIQGNIIPPVSCIEGFNKQNNLSDYYFAKVRTIGGNIRKSVVRYDHNRKKWLFGASGENEVIKYYNDADERFEYWLENVESSKKLDRQTMRSLFDAMDDEDK